MIARALAQDTGIILLDEPTAHLDIPNRMELLSLLRSLSRESGKAILLSIHDLEAALQIADKIWLMDESGHIQAGIPEDLILQSRIQKAFDGEGLVFDMQSGNFRFDITPIAEVFIEGKRFTAGKVVLSCGTVTLRSIEKEEEIIFGEDNIFKYSNISQISFLVN